jgi:transaldolase
MALTKRLNQLGQSLWQRLLFASTGTKDPSAPDTLYVDGLAAPNTVNTMPAGTLKATADHGKATGMLGRDGGDAPLTLGEFERAGMGMGKLAEKLQVDGAEAFVQSWRDLLHAIKSKSAALRGRNL